jgi:hypothetical protein
VLRVQNNELQDEIRTLRGQPFSLTPFNPLSASAVVGTSVIQSATSLPSSAGNDGLKKEPNCLRINTQARRQNAAVNGKALQDTSDGYSRPPHSRYSSQKQYNHGGERRPE